MCFSQCFFQQLTPFFRFRMPVHTGGANEQGMQQLCTHLGIAMRVQQIYHFNRVQLSDFVALDHLLYYTDTNGNPTQERPTLLLKDFVFLNKMVALAELQHVETQRQFLPGIGTILSYYQWELSWLIDQNYAPLSFTAWVNNDGMANGALHPDDWATDIVSEYVRAKFAPHQSGILTLLQFCRVSEDGKGDLLK